MFNPIHDIEMRVSGYGNFGIFSAVFSRFAHRYREILVIYALTYAAAALFMYPIRNWAAFILISNIAFFALSIACFLGAYAHALITRNTITNSLYYIAPFFALLTVPPIVRVLERFSFGDGARVGILASYVVVLVLFIKKSHSMLAEEAAKVNFALLQNELPYEGDAGISSEGGEYETKKCYVSFELRPVVVTRPGVALFKKVFIDKDTLKLYIGCERPYFFGRPERINFKISAIDGAGKEHFLAGKSLSPRENWEHTRWNDITLDVKAFIGQEVIICLKSFSIQQGGQRNKVYWGVPSLSNSSNLGRARKNILILLDACRPDYLGCYNASMRNISPNIDRFSRDAVMWTNAFSQGTWTLPSFISIFTGCFPSTTKTWQPRDCAPLSGDIEVLTDYFKKSGFRTAAFVSHQRGHPNYGFSRGFDLYHINQRDFFHGVSTAGDSTVKAIDFLERTKEEDVFLVVHIFDTHPPHRITDYVLNEEDLARLNGGKLDGKFWRDPKFLFKSSINNVDKCFSKLMEYLRLRGWYEESAVIISSDHAKMFDKHKYGHFLYDERIRIPLLVKYPAAFSLDARKIDIPVEATNAFLLTLLDINGIAHKVDCDGVSLHSCVKKDGACGNNTQEKYAISEDIYPSYHSVACSTISDKLILSMLNSGADPARWNGRKEDKIIEYYDLKNDRSESEDLSSLAEKQTRIALLKDKIESFLKNRKFRY